MIPKELTQQLNDSWLICELDDQTPRSYFEDTPDISQNVVLYFNNLKSTNLFAKSIPTSFFEKKDVIFITENQSEGRGRLDRSWHSTSEASLTFTYVKSFPTVQYLEFPPILTGAALAKAISPFISDGVIDIKWPNDILIDQRKVAGVLIESKLSPQQVTFYIGIGLNVGTIDFPVELRDIGTSMQSHSNQSLSKFFVFDKVIDQLTRYLLEYEKGNYQDILAEYTKRSSYVSGKQIKYIEQEETYHVTTDGLDEKGALYVINADKKRQLLKISEIHSVRGHHAS